MEEIYSSYAEIEFGEIFTAMVMAYPPYLAVELGVLHGYSTIHIALGLKRISETEGHSGHLYSYDIFEDFPYRHGKLEDVQALLDRNGISKFVSLEKRDIWGVEEVYEEASVDLVHIDINNDGDIFNSMIELWTPKLRYGSIILFEGGSEERDNVDWMLKHNRKPIKPALESNELANSQYIYGTYSKFPSLTVLLKKT